MVFLYDGKLNDLDVTIAKKIEENPQIILDNNIFDAAAILGISASKLTKYCQKISLHGFKEIKYKIQQYKVNQLYLNENIDQINIKDIINHQFYKRIIDVPPLIRDCEKIIVICDDNGLEFGNYITKELRKALKIDTICYTQSQDFTYEYINSKVLTIILDETGVFDLYNIKWYRLHNNYIQISSQMIEPAEDYYPISFKDANHVLPFDVGVIMLISWFKNKRQS